MPIQWFDAVCAKAGRGNSLTCRIPVRFWGTVPWGLEGKRLDWEVRAGR